MIGIQALILLFIDSMRSSLGIIIFLIIMLLLDLYVFQAVKAIGPSRSLRARNYVYWAYWGLTIIAITGFLAFVLTAPDLIGRHVRSYIFFITIGLFIGKLTASVFLLTDDIRRGIQWVSLRLFSPSPGAVALSGGEGISRSTFLSWLGLMAGSSLFGSLVYGMANKYNYQLRFQGLSFTNLPAAFKGLKIVHISDIHCGSFTDKASVEKGINLVMQQSPDLIVFTGDLVNDRAAEMDGYKEIFSRLRAPMGVYSILGNHDYGDYVRWPINGVSKEENLSRLIRVHEELGWKLLMNEHVVLEREGEQIALLGVENWSAKSNFPKRGRMDLAYRGTENYPFKILLSHDPSHWEAEVQPDYSDIDLVLSGHTHGMQFGVEIPGFRWSPVQYVYRQWAGFYEKGNQKLYVNRGFGFVGYPGRVGILPEVTVLTLG